MTNRSPKYFGLTSIFPWKLHLENIPAKLKLLSEGLPKKLLVQVNVWDFAIPNENNFKASLQHEGFVSQMSEKEELEIYQLMKRNRVLMDPTYEPKLIVSPTGKVSVEWTAFECTFEKIFVGRCIYQSIRLRTWTGYGEPIETFLLPFDVYGKHETLGLA